MKLSWLLWMTSVMPQPLADQTCLATTVYLEARSEPAIGQLAVAEVALRRREQRRWGNTVCEVVKARGQFAMSITNKNYKLNNLESWMHAWIVSGFALDMWSLPDNLRMLVVPGANHFLATYAQAPWATGAPLAVIGEHRFFAVN